MRCDHDEQVDATEHKAAERTGATAGHHTTTFSLSPMKSIRAMSRRSRLLAGHQQVAQKAGANPSHKSFLMKPLKEEQASLNGRQTPGSQHKSRIGISHSVHGKLSQSLHGALCQSNHGELKRVKVPKSGRRESDMMSQSLHRVVSVSDHVNRTSLKTDPAARTESPSTHSMRLFRPRTPDSAVKKLLRDDSTSTFDTTTTAKGQSSTVPYFEKLCWACEELGESKKVGTTIGSDVF